MSSLSAFLEHLPPNDRLILLLKEVQNTHKSQLEVKRILKLVKKEKQNIIFELQKYEQLFNTYNELQNKLNQLLNKCQQLSKHKIYLFKTIHQIADRFKPNNNNININNNNESDKQSTPLCLKEEDIIDIQLKQLICKAIPRELEFVPNLPLINTFDKNCDYSQNKFINNNKSFDDLKKTNFVYNSTFRSNDSISIDNNNDNNVSNNEKSDQLSLNTVVSNTCVEQIISGDKPSNDESLKTDSQNELTQEIDLILNEENSFTDDLTEDQNLILSDFELHENDIIIDEIVSDPKQDQKSDQKSDEKALKSKVQIMKSSHISKLRKNLNESEDQHLFKELSLKEYSKHTNDSNEVIKSVIKKRHHKNNSRISPKKIQSIITTVSKNHSRNRDTNEKLRPNRNNVEKERKDFKRKHERNRNTNTRDEKKGEKKSLKQKERHESKPKVFKTLIKSAVKQRIDSNEQIVEPFRTQSIERNDETINKTNQIIKETVMSEKCEKVEHLKPIEPNDGSNVSQFSALKPKRAKLTFKLQRNTNLSPNMIPNRTDVNNSVENKQINNENKCLLKFEELYKRNIESQKKLREELLRQKEERRKNRAIEQQMIDEKCVKTRFISCGLKNSLIKAQLKSQKQTIHYSNKSKQLTNDSLQKTGNSTHHFCETQQKLQSNQQKVKLCSINNSNVKYINSTTDNTDNTINKRKIVINRIPSFQTHSIRQKY